jgi:hypothetical protein
VVFILQVLLGAVADRELTTLEERAAVSSVILCLLARPFWADPVLRLSNLRHCSLTVPVLRDTISMYVCS